MDEKYNFVWQKPRFCMNEQQVQFALLFQIMLQNPGICNKTHSFVGKIFHFVYKTMGFVKKTQGFMNKTQEFCELLDNTTSIHVYPPSFQ